MALNLPVFLSSACSIVFIAVFTIAFPQVANETFSYIKTFVLTNGSWFYVLMIMILFVIVVFLGFSKYGHIKLGKKDCEPEYSLISWIAMLFSAGMGIGLLFFGIAEPLMHFTTPPSADPETTAAIRESMKVTFLHWGFHAWALYSSVGLLLAYYCYRKDLPLAFRSVLYPFLGDKIYGWQGNLADIFAVVCTIFGVSTSLGLGSAQVNAGLNYLFDVPVSSTNQLFVLAVITSLAAISVATGLNKGIKYLSELNMFLAVILLAIVLFAGPTVYLFEAYIENMGEYLGDFVRLGFNSFVYERTPWFGNWTIFYWAWWISWATFVGLFIAKISRGRTIREFVLGVTFIPTVFTLFWMSVFGNSAISLVINDGATQLSQMINSNAAVGLFVFLEHYPATQILSVLSIVMIFVFLITSCDSCAMVCDMLCSNGEHQTPVWQRVFWALALGLVAGSLTIMGGLSAFQAMALSSALPFSIILLFAMFGLVKSLKAEIQVASNAG